jgi:translation initiation factor eIF-2B subunit beta
MTLGLSTVVLHFLKEAARIRKFQVIIGETAPCFEGQEMAVQLASAGIETTVITDSAIYAVMSRVNKVILGVHAVTANGGIVAASGSRIIASAAKHHSTPVVVCASLHSLTPSYIDKDQNLRSTSPHSLFHFENGILILM